MFTPLNEQGVIVLFAQRCHEFGMEIVSIRAGYPDAVIKWRGNDYSVEFEYQSSNFYTHGHDPRECDMIVCWNDDHTGALPIVALKYDNWLIGDDFCFSSMAEKEAEYWRLEAVRLSRELARLKSLIVETDTYDDIPGDWRLIDDKARCDMVDMTTAEIVAVYAVSDSTARRWKRQIAANGYHKEAQT